MLIRIMQSRPVAEDNRQHQCVERREDTSYPRSAEMAANITVNLTRYWAMGGGQRRGGMGRGSDVFL